MKKFTSTLLFVCLISNVLAQDQVSKNIMIGVYTNVGYNLPVRFSRFKDHTVYFGGGSYTAGVKFTRYLSDKDKIEIGACYSVHKVAFASTFDPFPESEGNETFETFNIPVILNHYLNNNWFLSAGTIIDIGLPRRSLFTDTQTGFGFSLGAGRDFKVSNFIINVTPDVEVHSLIPFSSVSGQQRLLVLGIRLGFNNDCR